MEVVAIIGPTASFKSRLSLELARQTDSYILSLDSLSVYKRVDIASAKPSLEDRKEIKHFAIDVLEPNGYFNVGMFFDIYKMARNECNSKNKNLIISGGTSFYLKSMLDGLSRMPLVKKDDMHKIKDAISSIDNAYKFILKEDFEYASSISSKDSYRIQKWYEIYFCSNMIASQYFKNNKKIPIVKNIKIFEVELGKEQLTKNIKNRTENMFKRGLIEEVLLLDKLYGRKIKIMGAIGIKESILFIDGKIDTNSTKHLICSNTLKLAKRQITFNKTQLKSKIKGEYNFIFDEVLSYLV